MLSPILTVTWNLTLTLNPKPKPNPNDHIWRQCAECGQCHWGVSWHRQSAAMHRVSKYKFRLGQVKNTGTTFWHGWVVCDQLLQWLRTLNNWHNRALWWTNPGPSWATVGPKETFLRGPRTFSWDPSGEKISEFFFQNGAFWCTLYFWPTAGPPNLVGPGVAYPPTPPSWRAWTNLPETYAACFQSNLSYSNSTSKVLDQKLLKSAIFQCSEGQWHLVSLK